MKTEPLPETEPVSDPLADSIAVCGTSPELGAAQIQPENLPDATTMLDYASPPHPEAGTPPPAMDRKFITAALMLVMVLASMEMTITSTAMPTIIGDLHGLEHYSWVASVYLLAMTVSMPLYGRLADVLGRKRVVMAAIAFFAGGSVLAAFSHNMFQLIAFRGIQGLGAGGIMPIVLTILGDIFTLKERAGIQGLFSAVWGTSALAGPALGAFLVNTLGWRSIFFVNLPFGILGMAVLAWKYHDHERPHSRDLDLPGLAWLSIGCISLMLLVSRLGPDGWSSTWIVILAAIFIASTALFIQQERRTSNPVMPPALMMKRAIGPSMIASGLLGIGFLSLDTYVPLYIQGARGGGATAAAGVVTPVMLTWAISGIFAAPLVVRWGFRKTAFLGFCIVSLGFAGLLMAALLHWSQWWMTAILAFTGLGFGPSSMSLLLAAQEAVTWQHRGIITSGVQFFRTIGGAVGIGVLGALFNALVAPEMRHVRERGINPADLLNPDKHSQLPPDVVIAAQQIIGSGLIWVFAAMLASAVLGIAVSLLMSTHHTARAISRTEALEAMAG